MATDEQDQETTLAELLTARLCHDMAGLCGTLTGALELAAEEAEALPLAQQAAAELAARLALLRAAWGPPGEERDAAGLRALAAGLPGARRLTLDFSGLGGGALPPGLARLALNALLLAAEALPGGGALSLSGGPAGLEVTIAGRRAAWPATLNALFTAPEQAGSATSAAGVRGLQPPLTVILARREAMRLDLTAAADGPDTLRIEPLPA